jgi:hypothetical protein
MKDPSRFLNWAEVSRELSGSRQTVRRNKIPKIHRDKIRRILEAISEILKGGK